MLVGGSVEVRRADGRSIDTDVDSVSPSHSSSSFASEHDRSLFHRWSRATQILFFTATNGAADAGHVRPDSVGVDLRETADSSPGSVDRSTAAPDHSSRPTGSGRELEHGEVDRRRGGIAVEPTELAPEGGLDEIVCQSRVGAALEDHREISPVRPEILGEVSHGWLCQSSTMPTGSSTWRGGSSDGPRSATSTPTCGWMLSTAVSENPSPVSASARWPTVEGSSTSGE